MFSSTSPSRWILQKYKKLKSEADPEENDVTMTIDSSQRQLIVYCQKREREKVQFSDNDEEFPRFRVNNLSIYVLFNSKFEGFRVSFRTEDRNDIVQSLKQFERPTVAAAPAVPVSNPYAPPATQQLFAAPAQSSQQYPRSFSVPNPYCSLARDYFTPPFNPPPSAHRNQPANYQNSFREYSNSPAFSLPSVAGSSHLHPLTPSPLPYPTTQPVGRVDKEVQTDDLVEQALGNTEFMKKCLRNLMKEEQFKILVKTARSELKGMSEEESKYIFQKFSNLEHSQNPSLPSTSQPALSHQNSDVEFDSFFSLRKL